MHRPDLLDREQHAVVGLHQRGPVGRAGGRAERVVRAELRRGALAAVATSSVSGPARPAPRAADGDAGRGAGRRQPDQAADDAGRVPRDGAGQAGAPGGFARHQTAPAEPT